MKNMKKNSSKIIYLFSFVFVMSISNASAQLINNKIQGSTINIGKTITIYCCTCLISIILLFLIYKAIKEFHDLI